MCIYVNVVQNFNMTKETWPWIVLLCIYSGVFLDNTGLTLACQEMIHYPSELHQNETPGVQQLWPLRVRNDLQILSPSETFDRVTRDVSSLPYFPRSEKRKRMSYEVGGIS